MPIDRLLKFDWIYFRFFSMLSFFLKPNAIVANEPQKHDVYATYIELSLINFGAVVKSAWIPINNLWLLLNLIFQCASISMKFNWFSIFRHLIKFRPIANLQCEINWKLKIVREQRTGREKKLSHNIIRFYAIITWLCQRSHVQFSLINLA